MMFLNTEDKQIPKCISKTNLNLCVKQLKGQYTKIKSLSLFTHPKLISFQICMNSNFNVFVTQNYYMTSEDLSTSQIYDAFIVHLLILELGRPSSHSLY